MTGHGAADAALGAGRISIEIRAVNHRYLDARVRLPVELSDHAAKVEEHVRKSLRRGRVEVSGRLDGEVAGPPQLDEVRARAAFEQLCALRDELRPDEPVPLTMLTAVPGLFSSARPADDENLGAALIEVVDRACQGVWAMREREGAALAEDLETHVAQLLTHLDAVEVRCGAVVDAYRERLRKRLQRLLADSDVTLDEGRLEHEVAVLADRADISEEVSRLRSHADQLRALMASEEGTAGKRLDFLLQEMSRETNTIGAKSQDAELARAVIEMKTAISRMREQAQNVL